MFLINMLTAQLSCCYNDVFADMVGYARLKRMRVVVESMTGVKKKRWDRFIASLQFDKPLEFNEGDIGLNNGIQIHEPAALHPTTVDQIKRFGGSTALSIQWPEEEFANEDDTERFERLDMLIKKTIDKLARADSAQKKKLNDGKKVPTGSEQSSGSASSDSDGDGTPKK